MKVMAMEDKNKIQEEYNLLKKYCTCLEEMVEENVFKAKEFRDKAVENEDKPVTVRNCLTAAERCENRAEALRNVLALADNELLHYMEILSID